MKIKSSEWNKLRAAVSLCCKYILINIKSQRHVYYIYTVKPNAQIPYFEKKKKSVVPVYIYKPTVYLAKTGNLTKKFI